MLTRNRFAGAAAAGLVTVLVAATVYAFPTTNYNRVTFNKPVALPGVTLPAGTYRFEIANPDMNRDIVRVSDPGTGRIYLTAFTHRVRRPHGLTTVVVFGEAREGQPAPITVWYPIDSGDGHQFVY